MSFSATDAAFEGFRLVRRKPLALVAWTLVYLVYSVASLFASAGMMRSMADFTTQAEALENGPQPTSWEAVAPMFEALGTAMGHVAWTFPVSLIISAVLAAAVARGVLTPKAGGFGYLRLGMDELRVFVVTLVICILSFIAVFLAFMLAVIVGIIAAQALEGWGVLIGVLAGLAACAFTIWLMVRWSLAVPITVHEKKFAFFDSFALTKGRFWPLLGMACIALVMTLLICLLSMIVTTPLTMMTGMTAFGNMGATDPDEILKAFDVTNPWVLASTVVNAIVYALTVGILYAPFSAAYAQIKGVETAEV